MNFYFKKCFLEDGLIETNVAAEYTAYLRLVGSRIEKMKNSSDGENPTILWEWWREISHEVPNLFMIAKVLILAQPSSAAIKRFYAKVKANTDATQGSESSETFFGRTMALYNTKF